MRCVPRRSYAPPKRGPPNSLPPTHDGFAVPSPACRIPLVRTPVPGTTVPIAAAVLAAPVAVSSSPVRGSTAFRLLPEQTTAPLLQPEMYSRGDAPADH